MKTNPAEAKHAYWWLIGAGFFALGLCFALYEIDESLSRSRREAQLGATLKELRNAQAQQNARASDERMFTSLFRAEY